MWAFIGGNLCGPLLEVNLCGLLLEVICVGFYWR